MQICWRDYFHFHFAGILFFFASFDSIKILSFWYAVVLLQYKIFQIEINFLLNTWRSGKNIVKYFGWKASRSVSSFWSFVLLTKASSQSRGEQSKQQNIVKKIRGISRLVILGIHPLSINLLIYLLIHRLVILGIHPLKILIFDKQNYRVVFWLVEDGKIPTKKVTAKVCHRENIILFLN